MTDATTDDSQHFTKAVTQLGEVSQVIASQAIYNNKGVKIIDKGAAINMRLYERLMQHQLSAPIEDSVTSGNAVNGKTLRATAEAAILSTPFFGRLAEDPKTRMVLLDAIEKIPLPGPIAFQLTLARDLHPQIYLHSVWMALMAGWLALEPLGTRFDIGMAAAAGLLHDIGMLHLDPLLLQPWQQLDEQQRRQLYAHPVVSKALIDRHHEYTKEVVRAVLEHHEFLDGSGYPRHLAVGNISALGRIVAVAEVVTAMFAPGREAGELRISVILRLNTHRYEPALVAKVLRLLKPAQDEQIVSQSPMPDAIGRLVQLNTLMAEWPAALIQPATLPELQRLVLAGLTAQVSQLNRALATAGAAPAQLAQLGADGLDDLLQQEMSLLASEATWQLRTLARSARRQWQPSPQSASPDALLHWLDAVDALVDGKAESTPSETSDTKHSAS